jgi:hypothetical protein
VLALELGERLCGQRHIAVLADEREGGGSLEHFLEGIRAGPAGRDLRERVLDHAEAGPGVVQLHAQVGHLGDRDAAVVDREHRLRLLDLGGDLLDHGRLLFLVHSVPLSKKPAQAGSRNGSN